MEHHAVPSIDASSARPAPATAKHARPAPETLTTLHLTCEATGGPFDYDVPSDAGTLKDLWNRRLMVSCPHCRQVHDFLFRTAFVQAMLDRPRLPFGPI
jgi:hypothetical protein